MIRGPGSQPDIRIWPRPLQDCTLKIWDSTTGTEIRTLAGHSQPIGACAFSPDGGSLLSGSWDGSLKIWDVATGAGSGSGVARSSAPSPLPLCGFGAEAAWSMMACAARQAR